MSARPWSCIALVVGCLVASSIGSRVAAQALPGTGQFGEAVPDDYEPPQPGRERSPDEPRPLRLEPDENPDLQRNAFTISDDNERPPSDVPSNRASPPSRFTRALVELCGMVVGGAAGALAGTIAGAPAVVLVEESGDERKGLIAMGAAVGAALAAPLGLWVGGRLMHGDGSLAWVYAGAFAGFWALALVPVATDASPGSIAGAGLVGFALGGIIAFELSSVRDDRDTGEEIVGRRISGGFAPLPGGGAVTAFGTF